MIEKNKHSHISADAEQQMYMELERNIASKNRGASILLAILFFGFIYLFTALFWALPDKDMSEEENRPLQKFPKVSYATLTEGGFSEDFASYMADQFPFRNTFIKIKAGCEKILLKGENNGVLLGDDGYLITKYDKIDEETLKKNVAHLAAFKDAANKKGIDVHCAFAGRTMDVAVSKVPAAYGSYTSDKAWGAVDTYTSEAGLEYIDLKTPLRSAFDKGEYVYYKTDHHWTTLGAFYAYETIADATGLEKHEKDHYTVEEFSTEFLGTTHSTAGIYTTPDTIEFFRFEGDERVTASHAGKITIEGMYKRDSLETKDKYAAFLGSASGRCDIFSGEDKETLIVVKDSFAHSLVPFLAEDYNIIMIDLRHYSFSLMELCETEGVETVLFLYNLDTLSNESGFRMLRNGIN